MKNNLYMVFTLIFVSLYSCGEDLVEKGNLAYQSGDYSSAIENWSIAQVRDSSLKSLDADIALAYLRRGEDIYQRSRNAEAYDGNLKKAMEYIPDSMNDELTSAYLNTLCNVAEAYLNTVAKNDNEKAIFIKRATTYLREATMLDSTIVRADSMLQKIKDDNFQELLNIGKQNLVKGDKTRKVDYYFTAKKYLENALEFDPKNAEIPSLLRRINARILPVLDYQDEVAMAITDIQRKDEEVILTVTVMNYLPSPIQLNLDNFRLVDSQGKMYTRADQVMEVFYADMSLKNTRLDQQTPFTEGVLVFPVEEETRLYSLEYQINRDKVSRKYFP